MSLDKEVKLLDVINKTSDIEQKLDRNFLPHGTISTDGIIIGTFYN